MKVKDEYTFGLPQKMVWKYLKDAAVLKNSLPGCIELAETTPGHYKGIIEIGFGPIHGEFDLSVRRLEDKPSSSFLLAVKMKGNLGMVDGKVHLFLKDEHGSTRLRMDTDVDLTGSISIAGDWVLENGAKKSLEKFFQGLEKEIKRAIYLARK